MLVSAEADQALRWLVVAHRAILDFQWTDYRDDYEASVAYLRVVARKRNAQAAVDVWKWRSE